MRSPTTLWSRPTPATVERMDLLDNSDLTSHEVARVVGISRSRMYALVAQARVEQEQKEQNAG